MSVFDLNPAQFCSAKLSQQQREDLFILYGLEVKGRYFLVKRMPVLALALVGALAFLGLAIDEKTLFPDHVGLTVYGYSCIALIAYWIVEARTEQSKMENDTRNTIIDRLRSQGLESTVGRLIYHGD